MSEDEARKVTAQDEESDEVEAHHRRSNATDDSPEETEGDADFEAHSRRISGPRKIQ
jgi:hypothetical protein